MALSGSQGWRLRVPVHDRFDDGITRDYTLQVLSGNTMIACAAPGAMDAAPESAPPDDAADSSMEAGGDAGLDGSPDM